MPTPTEKTKRLTPMMMQYMEVKENHKDCLLFYRLGDFYELFFEDAEIASKELGIVLTSRGHNGDNPVPMCGIPFHAYENYVSRLVAKGFKIAICEQIETPEEAKQKRGHKAVVKRDVVRIITPGTLTEDNLLNGEMNNFLCAIAMDKKSSPNFSISAIDISTGSFFIDSVEEKDISNTLAKIDPKEIIIADKITKIPSMFETLASYKDKLTIIPDSRFDLDNAREYIKEAFATSFIEVLGKFNNADIIACGSIIDYIKLTQKDSLPKLSPPKRLSNSQIVEIDAATRRNLELNITMGGQRQGSLFATINKTKTAGGVRLLSMYLNNPLCNKSLIDERLKGVEFFYKDSQTLSALINRIEKFPDLERNINRIAMGRCGPRDLLCVKNAIDIAISINELFNNNDNKNINTGPLPDIIKKQLPIFVGFDILFDILDSALEEDNLPLQARDGGFIKSSFNKELSEYRNINQNAKQLIEKLRDKYINESGIKGLKIKQNNLIGHYIEVNAKEADKLDPAIFIHRQTMASGMRYTTNELLELENKIKESAQKELEIELAIFESLRGEITQRYEQLNRLAKATSTLDVLSSLALLAIENDYTKPEIIDDQTNILDIKGGRHPVIEKMINTNFSANDCFLDGKEKQIALLTGPNMAGKSTYLRQNAVITIMAQMGSFVPAKSAKIGIVDKIFSRVGAADDLAKGRSTFMVEMIETSTILNQATPKSLVILDEVGRGTSTHDGLAIAWACLEHIHNVNRSRCIFATHYHELTKLEATLERLSCLTMRVEETNEKVIFLHKVSPGKADKSYGIHVAKLAGVPSSVIRRADDILQKIEEKAGDNENINNIITTSGINYSNKILYKPKEESLSENSNIENENTENSNTPNNYQKEIDEVIEYLSAIDIDGLSPRQALEKLYEVKQKIIEKTTKAA